MQGKNNEPHQQGSVLEGFEPSEEAVRYGVYDEGEGVLSAYFPARPSRSAKDLLVQEAEDRVLLLLSGSKKPHSGIPLASGHTVYSPDALLELCAPAEAIALETGGSTAKLERLLPSSLLCAPHRSLPKELGALFAVVLPDRQHFTVLTRDPVFLSKLILCQLELMEGAEFPESIREKLVAPLDPWAWREVTHRRDQAVQTLQVVTRHSERGPLPEYKLECVAPRHGGFWRDGWSW